MKAIVTGANGTVAPYVIEELKKRNIEVFIYDRTKLDILNYNDTYNFIKHNKADYFFHIATGPASWVENIVKACKELGVKFIFTSTVSIFEGESNGPYDINSIPEPKTEYGAYKLECEKIINKYDNSLILRLGWQIGYEENKNHMVNFLASENKKNGYVNASKRWYPSCSFLDETSRVIVDLGLSKSGLYMLNSNSSYSFYEIANYLNKKLNLNINIHEENSLVRNDIMIDPRVEIDKFKF